MESLESSLDSETNSSGKSLLKNLIEASRQTQNSATVSHLHRTPGKQNNEAGQGCILRTPVLLVLRLIVTAKSGPKQEFLT